MGVSGRRRQAVFAVALVVALAGREALSRSQDAASGDGARSNHWTIPPEADKERNPEPVTRETLSRGKELFARHCARCHGAQGRNDGPESDPAFVNANLTDPDRIEINPDGVVFYKIWNGKGGLIPHERMPGFGFKGPLSRTEVWAVVAFVQSLRAERLAK